MVELSCSKTIMKYILFFINFVFFVLGAAGFALGIWAIADKNKMSVLSKIGADGTSLDVTGLLESSAIILLVGGACILVLGFVGCCGAVKENYCLLCVYAVLLVLIVAIEIAAIAVAAKFKGKVENELKDALLVALNKNYNGQLNTSNEISLALDFAQVFFRCCGIDNFTDFQNATNWKHNGTANMTIPLTCCKLNNRDAFLDKPKELKLVNPQCPYTKEDSYIDSPCWNLIKDYLKNRIAIVIGIASGILILEIICLIFACCIMRAIKKGQEYQRPSSEK